MLRLGHKYQFDQFESIARKRMLGIFPTTFSEWESSTLFFRCVPVVKNKDVELLEHFAYDMLALSKETGPQCLLPTVYLFCLWSSSELVNIEHCMMTIFGWEPVEQSDMAWTGVAVLGNASSSSHDGGSGQGGCIPLRRVALSYKM